MTEHNIHELRRENGQVIIFRNKEPKFLANYDEATHTLINVVPTNPINQRKMISLQKKALAYIRSLKHLPK